MAVVPADVRNIAPEFRDIVAVPDAEVLVAIADAQGQIDQATWRNDAAAVPLAFYDQGVKWLTAHLLAISHPELSQTPGTKIRIWETAGAEEAGAYGSTRFGVRFHALRNQVDTGPQVL